MKYFLTPPLKKTNKQQQQKTQQQKQRRDTNGRDMATRTCACLFRKPVTCILTRSTLSDSAL